MKQEKKYYILTKKKMEINYPKRLNEKELKDPSVPAMFKRSRHNIFFKSINSQDYYELSIKTIRANRNI